MQDARSPCDVHDAPCRRRRLVRRWRPFPAARGLQDAAPGMTISSLLTPELVLPALPAQAKAEVLETLAAHVGLVHPHVDARRLADVLHERERQSTTALENGVAIPHVRLAGLRGPLAALARSAAGITCGAADGRPA